MDGVEGQDDLAYVLHVLGCEGEEYAGDAESLEWQCVGVIRMIRADHAVSLYVG